MKTSTLVAALALSFAASGAALAEGSSYDYPQAIGAGKSRADVQAELVAARADGSIKAWSMTYNPLVLAKSTKSRDEVKATRSFAHDIAFYGEDSGSFALSRTAPARDASSLLAGIIR
jgi:Domain of unknown function (DUF4148)